MRKRGLARWFVSCAMFPDGRQKLEGSFSTRTEALKWANQRRRLLRINHSELRPLYIVRVRFFIG